MLDQEFEWDDAKAASNLAKHGVSFEVARLVFDDVFAIVEIDDSIDYGEDRFIVTGIIEGRILSVVYTERMGRIRLVSARKSTKREQNGYYRHQTLD